jgi:hypothetical protein
VVQSLDLAKQLPFFNELIGKLTMIPRRWRETMIVFQPTLVCSLLDSKIAKRKCYHRAAMQPYGMRAHQLWIAYLQENL